MVLRSAKPSSTAEANTCAPWYLPDCKFPGYPTASEPFAGTLMASAIRMALLVSQLSVVAGVRRRPRRSGGSNSCPVPSLSEDDGFDGDIRTGHIAGTRGNPTVR